MSSLLLRVSHLVAVPANCAAEVRMAPPDETKNRDGLDPIAFTTAAESASLTAFQAARSLAIKLESNSRRCSRCRAAECWPEGCWPNAAAAARQSATAVKVV